MSLVSFIRNVHKLVLLFSLDYSRVEVAAAARKWPMKFGWLGRVARRVVFIVAPIPISL